LSTLVGNVVLSVRAKHKQYTAAEIASALAIIAGAIVTFIGLARIGWIVDFISLSAIAAFMTGSAISIAAGQVPALMGITGFNTRDATYKVIINTLKGLPRTNLNAALGLSALALLYIIRIACSTAAKKHPAKAKLYFFLSTLRTAFVILLYILISYLMNRHHRAKPRVSILGVVPRGFKHAGVPKVNKQLISYFASELPATVIVILIEHISISKSFGRINNYTINPSQELVAMGVTNLLGPFLGAYPATGSFSRTAIKSKAGVRTPFAGVITGIVVLLAIYALPAMFFYIPNAALSAVIIHAVGDLITSPKTVYKFWKISPIEVPIFLAGVFVTVFSSIENGIYTTVGVSAVVFIFRIFKTKGRFLGRVRIRNVVGEPHGDKDREHFDAKHDYNETSREVTKFENKSEVRHAYLPIDHHDGSNPLIELDAPYPGVVIYRLTDGFNYLNANRYLADLTHHVFEVTRRTNPLAFPKLGDRPWNDPGPKKGEELKEDNRPTLKAIVLDFSSVSNVDITSIQNLIDVRNQLDRYAAPDVVEWHFASVNNRWTKRALIAAGFGNKTLATDTPHVWRPIFSVADIGGDDSAATAAQANQGQHIHDLETGRSEASSSSDKVKRVAMVHGINRPLFHVDLTAAVESAIHSVSAQTSAPAVPQPSTAGAAELDIKH
jgi:sodium-independent sulfate anion transporter 11